MIMFCILCALSQCSVYTQLPCENVQYVLLEYDSAQYTLSEYDSVQYTVYTQSQYDIV